MSEKQARFRAPFMSAFRQSFEAHDARRPAAEMVDGERVVPGRRAHQRTGDETALKRDLTIDLVHLLNSINLASAIDLSGFDYVRRSILNHGLVDVGRLTSDEVGVDSIRVDLLTALSTFEPRINPASLSVERSTVTDHVNQRIRFTISAEMFCTPSDVPIDFVAEIEVGSGKLQLSRLPVVA